MQFPQTFRLRQHFDRPRVDDPESTVQAELAKLCLQDKVQAGQTVAISAGSRGIANIHLITRGIVNHVKSLGGVPFIVPAMGSHGGGTADGQKAILEGYGITETFCGCEIRASMETIEVCRAAEGFPVYFDRHASQADHVIVAGRIKPHTGFTGPIESGLMKMMLIGLGKHDGAKIYHRAIADFTFEQIVHSVAREVLAQCNILCGVAIVENAYDETALIEAVAPGDFTTREPQLLEQAKAWMPRLPFDHGHLLLVDQIGKNISGSGMDTNVIGRKNNDHKATGDERPRIKYIAVRGLTEATHGNACGIGMSEFCLSRVLQGADWETTRVNALTAGHVSAAMASLDYSTDRDMIAAALPSIGLAEPPEAKVMWITDTLHVAELECSAAYLDEAKSRDDLEVLTDPRDLPFDEHGMLPNVETLV